MKKSYLLLIIIGLLLMPRVALGKSAINWLYNSDKAKEIAITIHKPLMVVVRTNWDEASRSLFNKTFNDKEIIRLSRSFVCLQVSVLNKNFLKKMGISRYPTSLFLKVDEKGLEEIDRINGYQDKEVFINKMKDVLKGKDTLLELKQRVAKDAFKRIRKAEQIKVLTRLAKMLKNEGDFYEARRTYQRLIEIDRNRQDKYQKSIDYLDALIYLEQKRPEEAIGLLKGLPDKDARYGLIRSYLMDNNYDKALPAIDEYINDFPDDEKVAFLLNSRARYYFKVGYLKKAMNDFMSLIKNYPDTSFAKDARDSIDNMLIWPSRRAELIIHRQLEHIVVVAPDIKTYLYQVSLWTDKKIYPVLLKGSKLNAKFIKAFKPDKIKEVDSIILPGPVDEKLVYRALYTSWTDEDLLTSITQVFNKQEIRKYFKKEHIIPAGIVLTNPKDGAMPGGLALASARNEALDFLPYTAKDEKVVSYQKMKDLKCKITGIIKSWGYDYEGFLSGIDFMTIAGDFPYAYDYHKTISPGRYSLDDALGRDEDNQRYAYTGRLLGDWNMSIYQAMCSIFLRPKDGLFFNTYSNKGNWREYRTDIASQMLSGLIKTTNIENNLATYQRWKILTKEKGNIYGLLYINSSGGPSDWKTATQGAKVEDIPESVPSIVIYTHSNSAANPYDENTIAGRWLENGAYIYFGAVSEPYVQSFKTPTEVVADLLFGRPFSQSLRRDSGPWSQPWRLIYIGDPMYSLSLKQPIIKKQ